MHVKYMTCWNVHGLINFPTPNQMSKTKLESVFKPFFRIEPWLSDFVTSGELVSLWKSTNIEFWTYLVFISSERQNLIILFLNKTQSGNLKKKILYIASFEDACSREYWRMRVNRVLVTDKMNSIFNGCF